MQDNKRKPKSVRTSVSINSVDYEELQRIAEKNKVTIAWVVRDAVEKYLTANQPLFDREMTHVAGSTRTTG